MMYYNFSQGLTLRQCDIRMNLRFGDEAPPKEIIYNRFKELIADVAIIALNN